MEDNEDRFRLWPGWKVIAGEDSLRVGVEDTESGLCLGFGVE